MYYKVGFRYRAEEFGGLSRDLVRQVALRAEGIAFDAGFRGLHLIHASRDVSGPCGRASRDDSREPDAEMLSRCFITQSCSKGIPRSTK